MHLQALAASTQQPQFHSNCEEASAAVEYSCSALEGCSKRLQAIYVWGAAT